MHESPKITWLIRLRWVATAVQATLIGGVAAIPSLHVDLVQLSGVLMVAVVSNAGLDAAHRSSRSLPDLVVPGVLGLDIGLLTLGLWLSGGPMNPFSFLYVFYVAVAAVVNTRAWSWVLTLLAIIGYGLLYLGSDPTHHNEAMLLHLNGMWIAMAVTAGLIIYFVNILQQSLADREGELARIRANQQRLGSLTAMAAGAAHELATPLSTIALTSKDLAGRLDAHDDDELAEDAELIRSQVDRCRAVLDRMATDAGQLSGQAMDAVSVVELLEDALDRLAEPSRVELEVDQALSSTLTVPVDLVSEVLSSLIQNALDASKEDQHVRVVVAREPEGVAFEVIDRGTGMSAAEMDRATEPFYTTKEGRDRMGLGLYVAQQLAADLGGATRIASEPGQGTRVTLYLPGDLEQTGSRSETPRMGRKS